MCYVQCSPWKADKHVLHAAVTIKTQHAIPCHNRTCQVCDSDLLEPLEDGGFEAAGRAVILVNQPAQAMVELAEQLPRKCQPREPLQELVQ
jgi:hypothetical protein